MFWEKYADLCIKKGLSPNSAAKIIGISSGSITKWKQGGTPSYVCMKKISDYFGVPVSYLLGYTDDPTPEEKAGDKEKSPRVERLLSLLSNMTDEELDKLEKMIDIIKGK